MELVRTDMPAASPELDTREDVALIRERLIIANLNVVHHLAQRIHERLPDNIPIRNLYAAGIMGLVEAVDDFDPLRQIDFSIWAKFRVHSAIVDSLRLLDWGPCELRREAGEMEQIIEEFTVQTGRPPTGLEIARRLSMSSDDLPLAEKQRPEIVSGRPNSSGDLKKERQQSDLREGPANGTFERNLRTKTSVDLAEAISGLPLREQLVLTLYYLEEATMKEIGNVLGIAQGQISRIHAAAVRHVEAKLTDTLFREESIHASRVASRPIYPPEGNRKQPTRRCRDRK